MTLPLLVIGWVLIGLLVCRWRKSPSLALLLFWPFAAVIVCLGAALEWAAHIIDDGMHRAAGLKLRCRGATDWHDSPTFEYRCKRDRGHDGECKF